jgi:5-methylcytosine-specific restriction protein A
MPDIIPVPRLRGRELQRRRARLFETQPWCVRCLEVDIKTRAVIRDHKVPLVEGGTEEESNEQGLCLDCWDVKKGNDAQRGVRPSAISDRFRKSIPPRGNAGRFVVRRRPL